MARSWDGVNTIQGEKRMKSVKNLVEAYSNLATENLKEDYLKDNIKITTYVPFVKKVTYATNLVQITMIDKETGNIKVQSDSNYLFFVRSIIELYTNLEIENSAFYEEYDLLNQSGALDEIMKMISEKEINEFKMICDMKREDLLFNQSTPKAFINQQIERVSTILGVTLKPVLEKISDQLDNMDEKDLDKIAKALERGLKRVK